MSVGLDCSVCSVPFALGVSVVVGSTSVGFN